MSSTNPPSNEPSSSRPERTTTWKSDWINHHADVTDLLDDLLYLLDHQLANQQYVKLRCILKPPHHNADVNMVVTGINVVQADPVLGTYIELELEED